MDGSLIGMQAISAMMSVITNSYGCISPIWRLPMSRIMMSRATKTTMVRIMIIPILEECATQRENMRKGLTFCARGCIMKERVAPKREVLPNGTLSANEGNRTGFPR